MKEAQGYYAELQAMNVAPDFRREVDALFAKK